VLIGYLRGGTDNEDALPVLRQALGDAGCERVVEDLASGRRREQPELRRVLDKLQDGDVVVVPRLGCLGSSPGEVVRLVQRIRAAGAGFRSLAEGIDTTTPAGQAAAGMLASLAELGRTAFRERIGAGLAAARAQGRKGGRRPKLTQQQRAAIVEEVLSGRRTAAKMARLHRVSEATVSRIMAAHRAGAAVPAADPPTPETPGRSDRIAGVLPPSALDERLAIVGTSGSGKTYAAKGLVERLMGQGARVCVVDPLGVWWGLRLGPDGAPSPPPYPVVVFGGRHADVALDEGMGAALGHIVGTHALACVVDVSDLGSAAARRGFMTAFADALHQANTEPLHLVLDEADLWAPQRAQPDGYDLLGRIEEIVRRGRIRGFVPWLITQRPAVLHKDVLSQADILVMMKLTASQDRAAVGRWIEGQADRAEGRRILAALPRLGRGEGWVWAPSDGVLARVAFPLIRTFDSSRTPQRHERVIAPRALAEVDLSAIAATLAGMGAGTAGERDDPAAVGRRQPLEPGGGRLRGRDRELEAARARVAELEAGAAAMQARLDQAEGRGGRATPAAPAPKRPATGPGREYPGADISVPAAGGDAAGPASKRSTGHAV
jgi:DNA invertase Pin-like site-specific DNA recombinase